MKFLKLLPLLVVIGAIATLVSGGVHVAAQSDSTGIGGTPANPREDNPRSKSIFVYEIEPGGKVEDAVKVINNTDKKKTLLVYAADSKVASGGGFACAQKVETAVSVGTWIKLAKNEVTLDPGTSEEVPFTLSVPSTASAGEQNGCIVIQDSEKSSPQEGSGIALSFRSAIRVAVTIPGDITKDLDFTGPVVVEKEGDTIRLTVGLKNNGSVSLDADTEVSIGGLGYTAQSAGGSFPVLARSERVLNFEVDKPFWGGWYRVSATAAYNSDPTQFVGETGETKTIKSPGVWVFVGPEPLALGIELLVLAAIAGIVARELLHRKLRAKAKVYKVSKGESLHAIAKKHGVSWRLIAKINGLRAPYHIEPGQELKVPGHKTGSSRDKKTK
jgi:LysM repeat protein